MFYSRATWLLRPQKDVNDDEPLYQIYDDYPEFFSIRVHYKGTFDLTPLREYKGGQQRVIDQISSEYFNSTDIDVIALGAGYKFKFLVMYLWQVPGESLDNGLRLLQNDQHVLDFVFHASYSKFMDVYMDETPIRNLTLLTSSIPTRVKIVELEDGDDEGAKTKDDEAESKGEDVGI